MVTNKHLRLAVETEEERRARLENDTTHQTAQIGHLDGRRNKESGEDG